MRTIDEGGEDIVAVPQQPTSTVVVNIISNTVHDKYVVVSAHFDFDLTQLIRLKLQHV